MSTLRKLLLGMGVFGGLGLLNGLAVVRPPALWRGVAFYQINLLLSLPEAVGGVGFVKAIDAHPLLLVPVCTLVGAVLGLVVGLLRVLVWRDRGITPIQALVSFLRLGLGLLVSIWVVLALKTLFFGLVHPVGLLLLGGLLAAAFLVSWGLSRILARRWKWVCGLILLSGIVLFAATRQRGGETVGVYADSDSPPRVVLLGLDGATWSVIDPLLKQGRLPHLAALLSQGSRGPLRSLRFSYSPAIWTTIATGVLPSQHGVENFVVKLPGTSTTVPVTSSLRRKRAVWNILSERGRTVDVIGWQVSWPAETVHGAMISDRIGFASLPNVTSPETLRTLTDSLVASARTQAEAILSGMLGPLGGGADSEQDHLFLGIVRDVLEEDQAITGTTLRLLALGQPDLLAVYFLGLDRAQHNYWAEFAVRNHRFGSSLLFPGVSSARSARFGPLVERYYEHVDDLLGEIVRSCSPNSVFIVVSDHGFGPMLSGQTQTAYQPNLLLQGVGLLDFKENSRDIDWGRTRLYDFGNSAYSSRRNLYLNLAGREPQGTIPLSSWPEARTGFRGILSALRTTRGQAVFTSVELTPKKLPGGQGPDLVAQINRSIAKEAIVLPDSALFPARMLFVPTAQSGTHRHDGILVISGRGVERNRVIWGTSVLDITPTVLYLLGLPVAGDMEGKPMVSLFPKSGGKKREPLKISTYESGQKFGSPAVPSEADERIKEQLKALGYIE